MATERNRERNIEMDEKRKKKGIYFITAQYGIKTLTTVLLIASVITVIISITFPGSGDAVRSIGTLELVLSARAACR